MIRRVGCGRMTIAIMASVSLSGTSELLANFSNGPKHEPQVTRPAWFLQALNSTGDVVTPPTQLPPLSANASFDSTKARQQLLERSQSPNPRTVAKAERLLLWLDIAGAKSASERHRLIRKLPVTITTAQQTDGRVGVVRTFAARTTRVRVFIPAVPATPTMLEEEGSLGVAGPFVKDDCYNGDPEPCMTEEEMNDLVAVLAEAKDENDAQNAELAQAESEYEAFCNQHPEGCGDLEDGAIASGPSTSDATYIGCGSELGVAGFATAFAIGSWWAASGTVAAAFAGATFVAVATGALIVGGVAVAVVAAGVAVGSFVACKIAHSYHLESDIESPLRYQVNY